jgi:putative sugar O-methyltransferase
MPLNSESISSTMPYVQVCELAASNKLYFDRFKSIPQYKEILEHVTESQGHDYLKIVKEDNPWLLDHLKLFSTNDTYGSPVTFSYKDIGNFSPTTLRYIKVLSDLFTMFGSLKDMKIIEIGCGYGGQSKIISSIFNIESYTYVDLPEVIQLTEKYTDTVGMEIVKRKFVTTDNLELLETDYDLVISNYAFTECSKAVEMEYIEKIFNNSTRGYITCNFISELCGKGVGFSYTLEELSKLVPYAEEYPEVPLTFDKNIILKWQR